MGIVKFRVATEFNVVSVVVPEDVQARINRLRSEGRCLGCERKLEPGEKTSLCQCQTCYGGTYRAIVNGTKTREELMAAGAIASQPKGPKPKNAYTASLQKAPATKGNKR